MLKYSQQVPQVMSPLTLSLRPVLKRILKHRAQQSSVYSVDVLVSTEVNAQLQVKFAITSRKRNTMQTCTDHINRSKARPRLLFPI